MFLTVLAVVKFWRIFEHIKQYGTSSNLYNIAFRSRKAVKRSIFPIVKLASGVKVKKNATCFIHPDSRFIVIWNGLILVFVMYAISIMPYLSVFLDQNSYQDIFEDFMDVCFVVDLCLNFFITFRNKKDEVVTDRWLIAKNYFLTYFFIDLLSSIPFGLIFNNLSSFNKLLRLFKLPRLVKMTKITKLFKLKSV